MRIHLLSDLHLEFEPFLPAKVDADIVVLAGDIHVKGRGIAWARAHFDCPVLYVLGNHEYYAGHLQRTLEKMRAASDEQVRVLERDVVEIAGVRFLGATMWTDFAATGNAPLAALSAQGSMNDFRQIRTDNYRRIRPADLIDESVRTKDWLTHQLAKPFAGPSVVITHHAPTLRSLQDNPHAGGHLDAAYANRWEALMGGERAALWVHGHSHVAVDYNVAGTRVVCNPRGYPGEESGFNDRLVVTLEEGGTHESGNA
ncbi:metallophosphoesterase [Pseudomonas kuykendallii]|uniref:Serine/threonine protein phosphatase n=1 Tax=Pseudomonas kuykendallii TaxID=1007099 RepID=A0A2W5ETN7_9PSED|nr:metallophosphoesterase [Pseudomonas kuykendallii]PZP22272.1 MAG: serine/threonine protein phosphatase [Pseudomonas kuykendallii]